MNSEWKQLSIREEERSMNLRATTSSSARNPQVGRRDNILTRLAKCARLQPHQRSLGFSVLNVLCQRQGFLQLL